jgi:serine/threonine protein kinase
VDEQTIFLAALDIPDPAERDDYLRRTCGGDLALRKQVEELLAAHERSGEFLVVPALRQIAGGDPSPTAPPDEWADFGSEAGGEPTISKAKIDLTFLQTSTKPGSLGRLGHYEIESVIGAGGCGIVLKAFDEKLRRVVAVKVMAPELAVTSPARKRFLREARAAAAVRHENVVGIHAVEDQPIPFLVMEHIEGETLQEKLDRTGPLDARDILRIGRQIADGLAAAHAKGLLHRDIKPANILLETDKEHVKITDFGLARSADDASLTQSGVIAGTPLYMSPEQATGGEIDPRSDLFSLGSVLYVMCGGRPPFRAPTVLAVLQRVAEDQPRPLVEIIPEAPDWLTAIIAKLHAKKPADRFASAREIEDLLRLCLAELERRGNVDALKDILPPLSPKPTTDPSTEESDRPPRRPRPLSRWIAAALALLTMFCGLGLGEATGVTDIHGTIIRLFTPDGTLVVEVDDPGLSVSIDGEEIVIAGAGIKEIRLAPGQYQVLASKDGKVVRRELVTVARNGRRVVRISKEAEATTAPPQVGRRPIHLAGGAGRGHYRLENGEFIQTKIGLGKIVFGSPDWSDYDLSVETMTLAGFESGQLVFRCTAGRHGNYNENYIFYLKNRSGRAAIYKTSNGYKPEMAPSVELKAEQNRWYKIDVRARGPHMQISVDGRPCFDFTDDAHSHGYIGFNTHGSSVKWRNLTIKAPDGGLLWEGFPEVEPWPAGDATPDPDRRAAEYVLSLGGKVRINDLESRGWWSGRSGLSGWSDGAVSDARELPRGPFQLTDIDLHGNRRVTDESLALFRHTRNLRVVRMTFTSGLTDAGLAHFRNNQRLAVLDLWETKVSAAGLELFKKHAALRDLRLGGTSLTDEEMAFFRDFASLPGLTCLMLSNNPIGDDGVAHLAGAERLLQLNLDNTRITDAGLLHLRECDSLLYLDVKGTQVTSAGVEALNRALPQCKVYWNGADKPAPDAAPKPAEAERSDSQASGGS